MSETAVVELRKWIDAISKEQETLKKENERLRKELEKEKELRRRRRRETIETPMTREEEEERERVPVRVRRREERREGIEEGEERERFNLQEASKELLESVSTPVDNLKRAVNNLDGTVRGSDGLTATVNKKAEVVAKNLDLGFIKLPELRKEVKRGSRGGLYYVTSKGTRVYLKEYQREQCRRGELRSHTEGDACEPYEDD